MKSEKTLLFTFDYELFLGKRSGNVLESVITPTQEVLSILDEFNIKSIFFVDTTWLIKLKELSDIHPACQNKLKLISSQLINIVKEGHDVFPHLHPHWMDAIYDPEKDEFNLNNIAKYRINQLSKEEREKLFDESIAILKQIIHPHVPEYKFNGFRAGGWSIQPFEDFKASFKKHEIIYDFSVMPLVYQFTNAQQFDFSTCIKSSIYRFSNKVEEPDDRGKFIEITSDIIYIEQWRKFIDKIFLKFLYKLFHDSTHLRGIGVNSHENGSKAKSPFGINLTKSNYERVSIELLTRIKLSSYKEFISNQEFVQFVSHPKILTHHNIKMLKCLLKFAAERFHINSDFRYFSRNKINPLNEPSQIDKHSYLITATSE
jgi:peptidoglycan/xylan/chitin deacetylase (PgdA/CDA1 family)